MQQCQGDLDSILAITAISCHLAMGLPSYPSCILSLAGEVCARWGIGANAAVDFRAQLPGPWSTDHLHSLWLEVCRCILTATTPSKSILQMDKLVIYPGLTTSK